MFSDLDHHWMKLAIAQAKVAAQQGEVPVGSVIVNDNQLIAEGFNSPISSHDPTAHAEIVALRRAGHALQNYRLINATLYVTLEPCLMCVGAIIHARIKKLVWGAEDLKMGASRKLGVLENKEINHHTECHGGLLSTDCGTLLTEFFKNRRMR